jgi:hypothetical protein
MVKRQTTDLATPGSNPADAMLRVIMVYSIPTQNRDDNADEK